MNQNKKVVKKGILGTFTGKCGDSTVMNHNEMFLGRELFEKLFASDEYKLAMERRHYIGFLGHPEDPGCQEFKDACIVMTECHIEPNGDIVGTFDLIDTPVGRIVKAFIDAGVKWCLSIRGAGDVGADGNVDPDTFVFRGFDIVAFPAYDDAEPEFQQIAASNDLQKQVQYKKVCKTIRENLQGITSSTTIDELQTQFREGSDEYTQLEERKSQITSDDNINDEDQDELDEGSSQQVIGQQLEGMTQLYLSQVEANRILNSQLVECQRQLQQVQVNCDRKVRTLERITSEQIANLSGELDSITASYQTSVAANSRLKAENESMQTTNLKYVRKIEANSKIIAQKDSTISSLERRLRETVTASKAEQSRASNLDEQVSSLLKRVEAAEQLVADYQQAYANIYANALGKSLRGLPVTASTTVEQLKRAINCGTSTSSIPAAPAVEPVEIDVVGVDDEDGLVTC